MTDLPPPRKLPEVHNNGNNTKVSSVENIIEQNLPSLPKTSVTNFDYSIEVAKNGGVIKFYGDFSCGPSKDEILQYHNNAINIIKQIAPKIALVYQRNELDVVYTSDDMNNIDPRIELSATAVTTTISNSRLSQGNIVIIESNSLSTIPEKYKSEFWSQQNAKNAFCEVMTITTLVHEGQHLLQPHNPPSGKRISPAAESFGRNKKASEFEAYTKEKDFCRYLKFYYEKNDQPIHAKACEIMMEEAQEILNKL